ncbi:DUF6345 domain-containing protein [Kitasatospora sp. NPDC094011]|uniref:DUF6345 domain-containing protein n=1 Tax=Kitasatospora sp. NPDC094011 TaxID=3364090 RepID=UPI00380C45E8
MAHIHPARDSAHQRSGYILGPHIAEELQGNPKYLESHMPGFDPCANLQRQSDDLAAQIDSFNCDDYPPHTNCDKILADMQQQLDRIDAELADCRANPGNYVVGYVGAEWNSGEPHDVGCSFTAIPREQDLAAGVIQAANSQGQNVIFGLGNADTHAVHWWHPEIVPGAQSLEWIDAVNLVYFAGHGKTSSTGLSLASTDGQCSVWYQWMRLGVQYLRWLVLDLCDGVSDDINVMQTWWTPTRGDSSHPNQSLHVLCTFVGPGHVNDSDVQRGADFINSITAGTPISKAWLDAAFEPGLKPITIAFGVDDADALNRLNTETIANAAHNPVPSDSLHWFWRQ